MSHVETVKITVYEIASGAVTKLIECPSGQVASQVADGHSYIEGHFPPNEFRIVGGVPVPIGSALDRFAQPTDAASLRRRAYPPINDQIGAIMKFLDVTSSATMPSELVEMLDQIKAVKAAHPKGPPT